MRSRLRSRRIKLHFGRLPLCDGDGYRDPGGRLTQKIDNGSSNEMISGLVGITRAVELAIFVTSPMNRPARYVWDRIDILGKNHNENTIKKTVNYTGFPMSAFFLTIPSIGSFRSTRSIRKISLSSIFRLRERKSTSIHLSNFPPLF